MRQMQLNAVLRSTGTCESSQGDMAEFRPKSAGSETSVRSISLPCYPLGMGESYYKGTQGHLAFSKMKRGKGELFASWWHFLSICYILDS